MLLSAGACCRHAGDAAAAPVARATAAPGGIEMSEIEAQATASHAQLDHTGEKAVWIFFDNREIHHYLLHSLAAVTRREWGAAVGGAEEPTHGVGEGASLGRERLGGRWYDGGGTRRRQVEGDGASGEAAKKKRRAKEQIRKGRNGRRLWEPEGPCSCKLTQSRPVSAPRLPSTA